MTAHLKSCYNLHERLSSVSSSDYCTFSINDILEACPKLKVGKSVGNDGIAMEAFKYDGYRLYAHKSIVVKIVY
jgi:hypothetical protein